MQFPSMQAVHGDTCGCPCCALASFTWCQDSGACMAAPMGPEALHSQIRLSKSIALWPGYSRRNSLPPAIAGPQGQGVGGPAAPPSFWIYLQVPRVPVPRAQLGEGQLHPYLVPVIWARQLGLSLTSWPQSEVAESRLD